jgi:DnaK suppressor protein
MTGSNSLHRLTSRLITRRDALRKVLSEEVSRLREPSEVVGEGDSVDAAVDSANDEICSLLAEIESRELAGIEQALQRISEGRYGRCECCGDRIPAVRLAALPYTTRCIKCQLKDETRNCYTAPSPSARRWGRVEDEPDTEGIAEVLAGGGRRARGFDPEEIAALSPVRDSRTA